jgi:phage shock protein A
MSYNKEQKQDRKNLLWAALGILLLLNVLLLYFFYQERKENTTKDSVIAARMEEVLTTKSKLDSISTQLDIKIAQIQQLGGRVDSLLAMRAQLEKDKQLLKDRNSFSLKKYEDRIRDYEALLTEKDEEIASLRQELGTATARNQELSDHISGLEIEKEELGQQIDEYSTKTEQLQEKINIASALKAEDIQVSAISDKGKERDGGNYKAKRINQLKVNFVLGENAVAQANDKDIFLRVLDPDGAVLSDMATGSGSFLHNEREMIYSSKQRVAYQNARTPVAIVYGRGGIPLKSGNYTVELYSEGFKIGQGDFTVK